jgi:hypothetical protein
MAIGVSFPNGAAHYSTVTVTYVGCWMAPDVAVIVTL